MPALATVASAAMHHPYRRSMIGKIHVAKKELALDDSAYEALLFGVCGKTSSADCSYDELVRVVNKFKELGWEPKPKARGSGGRKPRPADHPLAMKARALWISLEYLAAVGNPKKMRSRADSEAALEEFAKRQLNCTRLQWADQTQMDGLIEALKSMGKRHGWDATPRNVGAIKRNLLIALRLKLIEAGYASADWPLEELIARFPGYVPDPRTAVHLWPWNDLDMIAAAFGRLLKTGVRN